MKISIKMKNRKILKLLIKSKQLWKSTNLSFWYRTIDMSNKSRGVDGRGLGMAWNWDASQLMNLHPNQIPTSQWSGGVVQLLPQKSCNKVNFATKGISHIIVELGKWIWIHSKRIPQTYNKFSEIYPPLPPIFWNSENYNNILWKIDIYS